MVKCKSCGKIMTEEKFNSVSHKCLKESEDLLKTDPRAFLKKLYEGGGCSLKFYESELAKIKD